MNELTDLKLKELLPSSIARDETIRNICDAIVEKLHMINEKQIWFYCFHDLINYRKV